MAAPASIDALLEIGCKSGLLEADALAAWRKAKEGLHSPEQCAEALVRDGLLTPFQAEKLLGGRWRGFLISGKYRLLERLGAGGMGAVYLCQHIHMDRRVALKVLPIAHAEDSASLARFYREAKAVARLDHPNIVRAHDIDKEDKLHFLVLEFVDGCNLHELVKKNGPLDPLRAAHYIRQAALGLQHAHEAGLVHRDVKPGNLLLDRKGVIRLLDLGLARFFDDDGGAFANQYENGYVIGTADYFAPEQTYESAVDIRADIYCLGGAFYYLLVGKSPFQEGTEHQKIIWHRVRMPKPLNQYRQDVPLELASVLWKMMAKAPDDRYQTPGEVASALEPFLTAPVPPPAPAEMPPPLFSLTGRSTPDAIAPSTSKLATPPARTPKIVPK